VLVAIIVALAISLTLFGVWAQSAVREHRQLATGQLRLQAQRLAEAGVRRAIARRASDSQFEGETWSVPADALDKTHAAEVRIQLAPNSDANAIRYAATAEFPVGAIRRVQITKTIEVPNPISDE